MTTSLEILNLFDIKMDEMLKKKKNITITGIRRNNECKKC